MNLIYGIPLLLMVEAFFSGAEIALLSADRMELKNRAKAGHPGAARALKLIQHPERIFASTLLLTSASIVMISIATALAVTRMLGHHSDLIAVAITSPLVLIFGEILPKTIFQRNAVKLAPLVAPVVESTYLVFYPITHLLGAYTSRLSRAIDPLEELLTGKKRTTREELRALLSTGKADSEIPSSDRRMIRKILDFRGTEAQHALIPLVKVDAIDETATIREALDSFQRHRHSRMPVFSDRVDNISGILEVSDLFSAPELSAPVRSLVRPAHYAPESQELEVLIREMRSKKAEMCVVVDEYGGAVGILTVEDIFEEIVGEIQDEFDHESSGYQPMGEARWWVPARQAISQLNEDLHLELPEGDYETIGGFLLQQFGRIPETGDELHYDTPRGTFRFIIRKANSRAIQAILIEELPSPKREPSNH